MTHVVQFTSLRDFMRDLTASEHEGGPPCG